ncbi:unnamed protein product [Miscanthus lutarioriparius]|uniref:SHSP domain-containing protein n=1 Tax=Miscanthus lutarioriparius TaxID=422564 RepID=A0A811RGG7_9POAL|nr:unnamed protein product [Miscanthus lutarioriparius]
MQFRKQPPSVVSLPWASSYACNATRSPGRVRRAPLFTCHANKYNYSDLQPNGSGTEAAPKASTLLAGENWSIMGDKDVIILKLSVGESPPKEKFKVETAPDQAGLVIRYTDDDNPASSTNVPLTMPRGYDGKKVQAKWFQGWLLVIIAKPKHDPNPIPVRE